MFIKEVSYGHLACIYLIKNTVKTVILWNVTWSFRNHWFAAQKNISYYY